MRRLARLAEDRRARPSPRSRRTRWRSDASIARALAATRSRRSSGVLAEQRVEAEPRLASSGRAARPAGSTRIRLLSASDSRPSTTSRPRSPAGFVDRSQAVIGRPAAGEHAQPREQPPLGSGEELVAPRDRAAQRPLPLRQVPAAAAAGRGSARAGRGSARAPSIRVRAAASSSASGRPPSRSAIARMAASASSSRTRPGRCSRARSTNSATPASTSSGGTGSPALAGDPQQLAARDEDPELGCRADQPRDDLGAVGEQLLEVVEDEQGRSDRGGSTRSASSTGCSGDSRTPDAPPRSSARSARGRGRGQVDEPGRRAGTRSRIVARRREREPRLAAAARPRQRDDPARAQVVADLGELARPGRRSS